MESIMKFLDNVFTIIDKIPDISQLPVSPAIFSEDSEKHDCDECEDKFDCKTCWKEAVIQAECHERIERLREKQDKYAVNAYHWVHRTTFVSKVCEFVGYAEVEELGLRPNLFSEKWDCSECRNRWIHDELHDPEICLECWGEAIEEVYELEMENVNGTGLQGQENGD